MATFSKKNSLHLIQRQKRNTIRFSDCHQIVLRICQQQQQQQQQQIKNLSVSFVDHRSDDDQNNW